jgi:1-acyl-sn-glycerol-3-phosphate acyltransferase
MMNIELAGISVPSNPATEAIADATLGAYLWYEAAFLAGMATMTLGFSMRTAGRSNMPAEGPVLVIANHQSYLDPWLVGLAVRRHLCYLARKTLFRQPVFARLIQSLNAVPIDQDGVGKEGIKSILRQLRLNQAVVVFPEGERTEHGAMNELRPGVHLLIRRAAAPLLPVGIAGAYDAWPRWRPFPVPAPLFLPAAKSTIAVVVGKPLDSRKYAAMPREQALKEIFEKIQDVQQQAEKLRRK